MTLSIKKKIGLSFLVMVLLFVAGSAYTIITLTNNRKASKHISEITDVSLKYLYDLRNALLQSEMFSINRVYLPKRQNDKDSFIKIQTTTYPELKKELTGLSNNWYHQNFSDSLKKMFVSFDQLTEVEKKIMNSLQNAKDYDNPVRKTEAKYLLQNELLPKTASLLNTLDKIMAHEHEISDQEDAKLRKSSFLQTRLISFLAFIIIFTGILFSFYLTKIITNPINEIRKIVIDLSKGITKKVSYRANGDEIGEMIRAVNQLSDKFYASAMFANEVGKRNFDIPFKPISNDDILGKALLSMRDNLKSADNRLNEAQHIAHLGNFEIDMAAKSIIWSDELYKIYGFKTDEINPTLELFLSLMHPDDLDFAKKNVANAFSTFVDSTFNFRFIRKDGATRHGYTEWKFGYDATGKPVRLYGVTGDITERREVEETLRIRNAELLKTNAELDKFVYSVSHDLRAPLSSMLGVVKITEEETQEPLTQKHLGMLKGSINRLDGFIQDILSYSRNARLEINKEQIDFTEILTDITNNLKYMSSKNRKVEVKMKVINPSVFCSDKNRIGIVLNNLISNAIRYQNPKAETPFVTVEVDASGNEACIIVKDNGIGISRENKQRVFDMFYRVASNSVGSGLGLYIVKETVDKLNGHIELESELGKGTTFTIHFPNLASLN